MAAKKQTKKKRLTNKEKAFNAQIKKELQEDGILPPDKPKLNRKKFGRETWAEFNEVCGSLEGLMDLREAIGCMVSSEPRKVTSEEVGVYKGTVRHDNYLEITSDEGRRPSSVI